ncbi:hypothetical protein IU469_30855 [Nocardia puris]|uniref:hypothetical protein n=1 Tax=Nocardia puris TaxID=208602 RepID=UPI00189536DD|nr:hypothetical protein [Nocardia puris]MBF6213145.1 hypothetical protein [Nocardia puris]MBF6370074.1 hypothetical protein [Nocardia puris]
MNTRTGTDPNIDRLAQHALALGLDSIDLDETVYETVHTHAAEVVNNTSAADFWDIYDRTHDAAAQHAADTNNNGLTAQLRLLTEHLGADAVTGILTELAHPNAEPESPQTTPASPVPPAQGSRTR